MKKAIDFLNKIEKNDEVVIIYNNDADGICSCVLIDKFLMEKTGKKSFSISQPMPMDKNLIQRIQTTLPTKIIFLDLAVDQQQTILKKLGSICDILIVDHHQFIKDMSSNSVVHYNPRFDKPRIYQSTSYLIYKICSKLMDMSDSLWISVIGMIADYNLKDSTDLVEEAEKKVSAKELKIEDLSTAVYMMDDISKDLNIPSHTRTDIWEIISKMEAIKERIKD